MSAKRGRGAKVLNETQDITHKPSPLGDVDTPNLSAIEKASFLEVVQHDHGNPLHSTAMEEDLNVLEEGQVDKGKAGKKDIPQTAVGQRGAAVKRKGTQRHEDIEKKRGTRAGGKVKARPEKDGEAKKKRGAPQRGQRGLEVESNNQPIPTAGGLQRLVGKKPAKGRSAGQKTSAARPVKNQQMKRDKKRGTESESGSGESSDRQPSADEEEEESDADTAQQRRTRVLSSDKGVVGEDKSPSEKKRGTRAGGKVKARPERGGEAKKKREAPQGQRGLKVESTNQPIPTAGGLQRLGGKKPAKGRSAGQKTSAARPVKNQQMKRDKKGGTESESGSGESGDRQPSADEEEEESDADTAQQRHKRVLSSDEEVVDEDKSWNPTPKKAKVHSTGRTGKSSSDRSKSRESSSGSASTEAEKSNSDEQRTKRRVGQRATELEVVLDAFLGFCDQYRESVESKAVKQSINSFTTNVKERILEKITSQRELRVLKRENAKVGSLIRKKTQKLLDAKHELMRARRQAWLLQKEKAELQLRLADLKQGQALLHDIRELNRQYLDYRHKHPKDKETYGASSLPALLLETKHIQAAEQQLRGINNRLKKRPEKNKPQK